MNRISTQLNKRVARAQRRKSGWNFILIPLSLFGMVCAGWLFYLPIEYLQNLISPETVILSHPTQLGLTFLALGLLSCSVGPGLIIGNVLAWLIVPLRKILDAKAKGIEGTSIRSVNKQLFKFSKYIIVIFYPIAILGGLNIFYINQEGITYRGILSTSTKLYKWTQIKSIETSCWREGVKREGLYNVTFTDGVTIDIFDITPNKFFPIYPKIQSLLHDIPFEFHYIPASLVRYATADCPIEWINYFRNRP